MLSDVTTDLAVLERLIPLAGKDVLDVGCGDGGLVRDLCAQGAHAVGVEISEEQLVVARARDPDNVGRYLVGRAERLPAAAGSVDVVIFMRSLHHVAAAHMADALVEAARALREDGVVYVAEPVASGSLFELVSLVEDEAAARAAAERTIDRADQAGLRRTRTLGYAVEGRYANVDAFRAHMLSVDPSRARTFGEHESEISAAFEGLGHPGTHAGERFFRQVMRADVLRHAEQSPGPVESRSADFVLDVGNAGRIDCPDLLELQRPAVEARE